MFKNVTQLKNFPIYGSAMYRYAVTSQYVGINLSFAYSRYITSSSVVFYRHVIEFWNMNAMHGEWDSKMIIDM